MRSIKQQTDSLVVLCFSCFPENEIFQHHEQIFFSHNSACVKFYLKKIFCQKFDRRRDQINAANCEIKFTKKFHIQLSVQCAENVLMIFNHCPCVRVFTPRELRDMLWTYLSENFLSESVFFILLLKADAVVRKSS